LASVPATLSLCAKTPPGSGRAIVGASDYSAQCPTSMEALVPATRRAKHSTSTAQLHKAQWREHRLVHGANKAAIPCHRDLLPMRQRSPTQPAQVLWWGLVATTLAWLPHQAPTRATRRKALMQRQVHMQHQAHTLRHRRLAQALPCRPQWAAPAHLHQWQRCSMLQVHRRPRGWHQRARG